MAHPSPDLYGSDRMLLESVSALAAAGSHVTVALPADGPLTPMLRDVGGTVVIVPTVVLRKAFLSPLGLGRLAFMSLRTMPAMVRAIRSSRADVVYVNTLTLPGWLAAARLARVPVVCHVHEAEESSSRLIAVGLRAPLLLTRRILVNSDSARTSLVAVLPRLRARIVLLYNGVAEPPEGPRPPRGELDGPVRLVLVGRISPRKGTDVAVAATALLCGSGLETRLDIAGDIFPGYEWFDTELRDAVAAAGIEDKIRFLGFLPDVWPVLADADIVLVPSRAEPFGNVAVEAALAQRVVVASSVQGLSEIVKPRLTGVLVGPDDAAALADAVRLLVADWPGSKRIAAAARIDALERFSVTRYAEQLLTTLYDVGLSRPTGVRG
jgi:glycosyltransferase involved in cell wall biosynthesis